MSDQAERRADRDGDAARAQAARCRRGEHAPCYAFIARTDRDEVTCRACRATYRDHRAHVRSLALFSVFIMRLAERSMDPVSAVFAAARGAGILV